MGKLIIFPSVGRATSDVEDQSEIVAVREQQKEAVEVLSLALDELTALIAIIGKRINSLPHGDPRMALTVEQLQLNIVVFKAKQVVSNIGSDIISCGPT